MTVRSLTHVLVHAAIIASIGGAVVGCGKEPREETPTEAQPEATGPAEPADEEVAVEPHASDEDARLAMRVHAALAREANVDASRFSVSVQGGAVTLTARQEDEDENGRAQRVAAATEGVVDVTLQVRPSEASARRPALAAAGASAEAIALYAELGTRRAEEPEYREPEQPVALNRAASGDRPRTYRVRAGDNLSLVASRTLRDGNQWRRIYEYNRSVIGPDPQRLVEGMELRIPQD